MTEIVFQVEEDRVDGGWIARALGVGITTQADTLDELKAMIRDALKCHFDREEEFIYLEGYTGQNPSSAL